MAGFRNVRPTREMQSSADDRERQRGAVSAPQVADLGGGRMFATAAAGAVGDTSPNYHDDPIVNALVGLPSQAEASEYAGTKPSFYGVQRPGDYQRVIQRQMAAEQLPGGDRQLGALQDNERERQKRLAMARPGYGLT